MIEPILLLLILAAAPFAWVVVDMWRQGAEQSPAAAEPTAAATVVLEQAEPAEASALAA